MENLLVRAAYIIMDPDRDLIEDGAMVLREGRIAAIGTGVSVPAGAEIVDATGLNVFPGFVDAHTHLGIWEEGVGRAYWDGNEATDPVTPHVRALDALNPRDQGLADARSVGVTTVCVTPGSANPICGQAVVIKTAGDVVDRMVVREPAGLKMALGENPKSVYKPRDKMPSTRMGTAAVIREALFNARAYMAKQARASDDADAEPPDEDLKLEAIALALRRTIPARIHAHRADDILTALRLGQEFELDITIEHCTEGHKVASDLESAMARVKHRAAPINNIRYGLKNPCVETGLCSDCKTPQRICNMWGIIEGHMIQNRIHVKLIGENLGY